MRLETDAVIPFDRQTVYLTYRDKMVALVPYLSNVREVLVEERSENDGVVQLVNVWHGGGEVPSAVSKIVDDKVLSWHDYATWTDADHVCRWRIETHAFAEAVDCGGETRFVPLANGRTRVEIHADMKIDLHKVRGVPGFVAGSIARTVEQFLVRQISTNLSMVCGGVDRYLADQAGHGGD